MRMTRINVGPGDQIDLYIGNQGIYRATKREVRDLLVQILVFCGSDLRNEVHEWLRKGTAQDVANYMCPEPEITCSADSQSPQTER